jgi:acyl carrier protein
VTGNEHSAAAGPSPIGTDDIRRWLTAYVATLQESDAGTIDVTIPFERFGMDSSAAVGMTGDLEEWLGFELDPTLPYDYPTIDALSRHLAAECASRAVGSAP